MQHLEQKHGGQVLLADSVGQMRWLNRQACVFCGTIRSQRCEIDTPLRELRVGDTSKKELWHQDAAVSGPALGSNFLRDRSQYFQENLWTTARFRTALSGTSF